MRVPARVFADEEILAAICGDRSLEQLQNVATLPRIFKAPDADEAHAHARKFGASRWLYGVVRLVLTPILRLWFQVRIGGAEHLPAEGAAIIAANHKGFLDPFFIALAPLA